MGVDPSEAAPSRTRAPRLNPFAFPSDTDFRFVLLMVSVLSVTVLLYSMLYDALPPTAEYKRAEYARCVDQAKATNPGRTLVEQMDQLLVHGECTALPDIIQAGFMLGGLALVVSIAVWVYCSSPRRQLRSRRLEPLSVEDAPDVVAYLEGLWRETGLSRRPTFVANPLDRSAGGLAFGAWGHYYVSLGGGLVDQFYTDRDGFRAVVLHELAHLRNGDVGKAYFTVAIWQGFLAAALAPFVLGALVSLPSPIDLVTVAWRVIPLTVLVLLMRNAVLQARELDADVRASTWDGPTGALSRLLESLPRPSGSAWRALLRVHPDPAERRLALDETERLLRMGFWDAFGTGCVAGIAILNVTALMNLVVAASTLILAPLIAALGVATLTVGVVGVGVWRTSFVNLARGEPARGAGRLGLGLGLGLLLGQKLSFADDPNGSYWGHFPAPLEPVPVPVEYHIAFELAWAGLLLASMVFYLRWIAAGAWTWLEVSAGDPSPRPASRLHLAVAGSLLVVWLGVLYACYFGLLALMRQGVGIDQSVLETTQGAAPGGASRSELMVPGAVLITVGNLAAFLMLVSLWALPLAPWLRHRRAATNGSSWAFLDLASEPPRWPAQAQLRPERALRAGLVSGAAFWIISSLVLTLRLAPDKLGISVFAPGDGLLGAAGIDSGDALALWIVPGQLGLAALLQMAVAATVAARVTRLGSLHGLFAASVAGCMMAIGAFALPSLLFVWAGAGFLFADIPPWIIWQQASLFTTWGPLLTLPVAMLASTVAARVRSRLANASGPNVSQRRNDPTPARGQAAIKLALVIGIAALLRADIADATSHGLTHPADPSAYLPSDTKLRHGFDPRPELAACMRVPGRGMVARTYLGELSPILMVGAEVSDPRRPPWHPFGMGPSALRG